MMLSNPNTEEQQQKQQEETTDILQRPTPLPASLVKKNKTAEDAMADLERRLQMLGDATPTTSAAASGATTGSGSVMTNAAVAPHAPAPAAAIPPMGGGKNALLARIKAAQERAKQPPSPAGAVAPPSMAQPQPNPSPAAAALQMPSMMDMMMMAAPQQPPPSMSSFDPLAPSSSSSNSDNNNNAMFFAAPSSSVPSALDDLMDNQQEHQQHDHDHAQAHDLLSMQPMAPPQQQQQQEESLESILAALEGLSDEEKKALLAEQGKIMASIEKQKVSSADARANAFEQRSLAGALRAPAANAMDSSNFSTAGLTAEEAEQMKADMELAEQLQREEYDRAERETNNNNSEQRRQRRAQQQSSSPSSSSPQQAAGAAAAGAQHEPGWMEWLGLAAAPAPAPPAHLAERRPLQRGEIGVSLPPGGSSSSHSSPSRGTPAGAQQQGITFTPSYDDADQAEDAAFLRGNRGSPAARVAQRQPLFSCVADSITSAATAMSTALQMTEDDEGNVHGVDSSGLLGMNSNNNTARDSNNNNESTTPYSRAG